MKSSLLAVSLFVVSSATAQTSDTSLTKNNNVPVNTDSVYTKVDVEAQFPGGEKKWNKFIQDKIANNIDLLVNDTRSNGTCTIKFIVAKDGKISAARVMSMEGSELAKIFLNAVLKGPNWIPAKMNGVNVKSIRLQKVTFSMPVKN
jgi:protein TonB